MMRMNILSSSLEIRNNDDISQSTIDEAVEEPQPFLLHILPQLKHAFNISILDLFGSSLHPLSSIFAHKKDRVPD